MSGVIITIMPPLGGLPAGAAAGGIPAASGRAQIPGRSCDCTALPGRMMRVRGRRSPLCDSDGNTGAGKDACQDRGSKDGMHGRVLHRTEVWNGLVAWGHPLGGVARCSGVRRAVELRGRDLRVTLGRLAGRRQVRWGCLRESAGDDQRRGRTGHPQQVAAPSQAAREIVIGASCPSAGRRSGVGALTLTIAIVNAWNHSDRSPPHGRGDDH